MMEKKKLRLPVIVEGKYDKITLNSIFDGVIVSVGGFAVFNSKEKQSLIKKIAKDGIVILTDSDGGGRQIRSFLLGIIPKEKIHNAYIPIVEGKEKRKVKASRSGVLGVEGMDRSVLERVLAPYVDDGGRCSFFSEKPAKMITKVDFFEDGLSGGANASMRRAELCKSFELPTDMTANALLEALNVISNYDEYKEAVKKLS